ncbi:hypothetical protein FVER14953_07170 [Fusarium verticillioides]|nr:hypothetical protein FVER14953_07170 [Fusarium verticillioides]
MLDVLDDEHRNVLDRAVRNVLSTEVAELVYAQILDGLPTEKSLRDSSDYVKDHPVHSLQHAEICPGFVDKAREFRNQFDLSQLALDLKTIQAFADTVPGSEVFNLRLIEIVAVACHQIGAFLFNLDDGAHKHKVYEDWRQSVLEEKERGVESRRYYDPPPIAFCHRAYRYPEQYPKGTADIAGYWAESKILGGVVVFDRGETEQEVWFFDSHHGTQKLMTNAPGTVQCHVDPWRLDQRPKNSLSTNPGTIRRLDQIPHYSIRRKRKMSVSYPWIKR